MQKPNDDSIIGNRYGDGRDGSHLASPKSIQLRSADVLNETRQRASQDSIGLIDSPRHRSKTPSPPDDDTVDHRPIRPTVSRKREVPKRSGLTNDKFGDGVDGLVGGGVGDNKSGKGGGLFSTLAGHK